MTVMPGPGKSFEAFQADQAGCKAYAGDQVKGQADQANQRAVGAAVLTTVLGAGLGAAAGSFGGVAGQGAGYGAASGSLVGAAVGAQNSSIEQIGIQQRYDNAFAQCMYAQGHSVPGFAPRVADVQPPPQPVAMGPDPVLVRGVQTELIRLSYLQGSADGAMGPKTAAAIRDFEKTQGMSADGAPTQRLLAKLQSTPTTAASTASATAPAPSGWVAPAGAAASPTGATAPAVVPAASAAPASATPAAPGGWVAPTKTQ